MSGAALSVRASLVRFLIFAVVTILATGVLAATIGGFTVTDTVTYHAVFTDATRLAKGDDVRVSGVKVGSVAETKIVDNRYAEVTFSVRRSVPMTTDTHAQIRYRNLVGERYLALAEAGDGAAGSDDSSSTGATPLRPGATIPLARTQPALDLTVLLNGFKPLLQGLDAKTINKLSYEIVRTLQGEGGTIDSLLASTASLTGAVADRDAAIGRIIDNLSAVLATVDGRSDQLQTLLDQASRLATGLAADRGAIGDSLTNINALADATASLLTDARPPLKSDIAGIGQAASTLDGESDLVNSVLKKFPVKANAILRLGQYGSWFNFFNCGLGMSITLPGSPTVTSDGITSGLPVCS